MADKCGCPYHPKQARSWLHCRDCGKPATARRKISTRGLCVQCASERLRENVIGISNESGPAYVRQLAGVERFLESAKAQLAAGNR